LVPAPGPFQFASLRNAARVEVRSGLGETMFRNPTVFILGAGASWHYGYPTGEALVEKVIQKASIILEYLEHSLRAMHSERPNYIVENETPNADLQTQWKRALAECQKLKLDWSRLIRS